MVKLYSVSFHWYLEYANVGLTGPASTLSGATGATGSGPTGPNGVTGPNSSNTGPTGPLLIVNIDNTSGGITAAVAGFDNVAVTGTVNVLTNDIITSAIVTTSIIAPPNINYEGTASFTGGTGTLVFTPAPRLLKNGIYGYEVVTVNGVTGSNLVFSNVNLNFATTDPTILYTNAVAGPDIFKYDFTTGATALFLVSANAANEMDCNRNDAILYTSDDTNIYAYDLILKITWTLTTDTDIGLVRINALGYDNKRNQLWVVPKSGADPWAKLSMRPYDRYNNPGVQTFTLTNITFPGLPVTVNMGDLVIEPETGYIYVGARITNTDNMVYKLNPYNMKIMANVPALNQTGNGLPYLGYDTEFNIWIFSQSSTVDLFRIINTANLTIQTTSSPSPQCFDTGFTPYNF